MNLLALVLLSPLMAMALPPPVIPENVPTVMLIFADGEEEPMMDLTSKQRCEELAEMAKHETLYVNDKQSGRKRQAIEHIECQCVSFDDDSK